MSDSAPETHGLADPTDPPVTAALLTPAEVAGMFRVDAKTVGRWAKAGRLRSVRTPGGHRRFYADDVEQLLVAPPDGVMPGG